MEELFQVLSSSARFNKSKTVKKRNRKKNESKSSVKVEAHDLYDTTIEREAYSGDETGSSDDQSRREDGVDNEYDSHSASVKSRDRTGKRDTSDAKRQQVHNEEIAAYRRSMNIRLRNKHDPDVPDPISSFSDLLRPAWWSDNSSYVNVSNAITRNIEAGNWKEPTPIQMQAIPALLDRRDLIGGAPTGSGKSGAFIIPAMYISSALHNDFYRQDVDNDSTNGGKEGDSDLRTSNNGKRGVLHRGKKAASAKHKNRSDSKSKSSISNNVSQEGDIRILVLAPSYELAGQLHREIERIGSGKPGGLRAILLHSSNVNKIIAGHLGGKNGLDVVVATPMRLVSAIEKGLKLDRVRFVVLDEADRLLDATDGKAKGQGNAKRDADTDDDQNVQSSKAAKTPTITDVVSAKVTLSGSEQSKSFLAQMDVILGAIPVTAVRALFSATISPTVRELSEFVLRNPVDMTVGGAGSANGVNANIEQELKFVGEEEGKLLAIRQIVARGDLKPPVIIFLESQERAQALFQELLYDKIRVDIIHAGRTKLARETAVTKFRKGETWVLICTDLVARGVDFRAVNMVINYDLPSSGVTYIHRIGRTGRAGRRGKAVTFFTEADFANLRVIANVMKQSGCDIPDWMLNLSTRNKPKSKSQSMSGHPRKRIDTTPTLRSLKKNKKAEKDRRNA